MNERRAKLTIYRDTAGEYRWRLKAGNGNVIADSGEGYKTRLGCDRASRRMLFLARGQVLLIDPASITGKHGMQEIL